MQQYDAGRDLADRYPHYTLERCPLDGALAAVLPDRRLILVADHLDQAGHDCSLAHEIVHLDDGDRCTASSAVLDVKRERAVDGEAARRLIPLERLAAALLWGRDEHELAQELDVDVATFRVRMLGLTEAEQHHIDDRADAQDWGAA